MMRKFVFLLLCIGALPALAADKVKMFEITPFGGYRIGGDFEDDDTGVEYDIDDDKAYGLIFNMMAEANTQWEFGWSRSETSVDVPSVNGGPDKLDLDIDYFQGGGTYLWDGKRAQPFMVATIGAAHLNPDDSGDSETYFAFSIGGGWRIRPTERLGLRLEGRVYGTILDSDSDVFCKTGPDNNQCLIQSRSEVLWQWQMLAGATFRF
ncbi:MAG: outer membrane beta-barrel protein [Chromatiales bacterium]|nr:MAG: outer membrane beta-barrel protein [Chromatiales bacterium]